MRARGGPESGVRGPQEIIWTPPHTHASHTDSGALAAKPGCPRTAFPPAAAARRFGRFRCCFVSATACSRSSVASCTLFGPGTPFSPLPGWQRGEWQSLLASAETDPP